MTGVYPSITEQSRNVSTSRECSRDQAVGLGRGNLACVTLRTL